MITDEDEDVLRFNLQEEEEYHFEEHPDQPMRLLPEEEKFNIDQEYQSGEATVYQELAEKDHYLMLAAEAGKVLLEKNQELQDQYQRLQEEYLHKVESLEQERHHLRRELQDRDYTYESRMHELQSELSHLSGQLDNVQKVSRTNEKSNKNNLDDIQTQNDSLQKELHQVKTYNQELAQQVQTLSKRIDGRLTVNNSGNGSRRSSGSMFPDYNDEIGSGRGCDNADYEQMMAEIEGMKNLKMKVQKLNEEKERLEVSLQEVSHEKEVLYTDHQHTNGKMSVLESEILTLKQQIGICLEDLNKTKKKNSKLKDQLDEYVLLQSQNMGRKNSRDNSLFNELEMSLSEADRNMQNMSTPNKQRTSDDDDDGHMPDIFITSANKEEMDRLTTELRAIYFKLRSLKSKLTDEEEDQSEADIEYEATITSEMVSKLVDQVISLIQERILSLGVIDQRMESPRILSETDEDNISNPESRLSDSEVEILEQKVLELNQRLNIKTSECDVAKKELHSVQGALIKYQETAEELEVKANKQEREIDALRKERDIILSDTTMEEKLKQALEERDEALKKANELQACREQTNSDMQKLNNQLITAIQQKVELGEQLEAWQHDMASVIHDQLAVKLKKDQKTSRKRSSSAFNKKSLMAKFFPNRSNNNSQSSTPQPPKSPDPPK